MKTISTMNARQAIFESEKLTNEMLEDAKRMSLRLNISTDQALDKLNSMYQRYAKTANEKAAWDIRTKNAKEKWSHEDLQPYLQ